MDLRLHHPLWTSSSWNGAGAVVVDLGMNPIVLCMSWLGPACGTRHVKHEWRMPCTGILAPRGANWAMCTPMCAGRGIYHIDGIVRLSIGSLLRDITEQFFSRTGRATLGPIPHALRPCDSQTTVFLANQTLGGV